MQLKDKLKDKWKKKENEILAAAFVLLGIILTSVCYDYYFDLNDDSAIKDILAGVYTGTPDGHNIQMLYGLSVLLALPYRLLRNVQWFGIFLCLCNFGCFYLIGVRSLRFCKRRATKAALLTIEGITIAALYLWEIVFVQYTVVSGLLAVTAVFLFYTSERAADWKEFLKQNVISIFLVLIAFAVRTEMLLLLFPMICLAGLFRWSGEDKPLQKKNFGKYGVVFAGILVGMLILLGIDSIAYGSAEWKEFRDYFNGRTQVYDFTGIPSYEGNEVFYEGIGLAPEQKQLLDNYNFGLDEQIDSKMMEEIAAYASAEWAAEKSFTVRCREAFYEYRYRLQSEVSADYPWNLFVLTAYLLLVTTAVTYRNKSYLWKLPLLVFGRSALWLFLLYRGRIVDRITHPLLMMEFVLLLVMLLTELQGHTGETSDGIVRGTLKRALPYGCACIIGILALSVLPESIVKVNTEYARRAEVNTAYAALQQYCKEHCGQEEANYYFFDVFSSVAYSEKMFAASDNSLSNYDLMGGWICKSPLYEQKLAQFGLTTMEGALTDKEYVYLLCRLDRPEADMEWLYDYYAKMRSEVKIVQTDTIQVNGQDIFGVYQLR